MNICSAYHVYCFPCCTEALKFDYYANGCHYTFYKCITISFLACLNAIPTSKGRQHHVGHVNCQLFFTFFHPACLCPPCLRLWGLSLMSLPEQKYYLLIYSCTCNMEKWYSIFWSNIIVTVLCLSIGSTVIKARQPTGYLLWIFFFISLSLSANSMGLSKWKEILGELCKEGKKSTLKDSVNTDN